MTSKDEIAQELLKVTGCWSDECEGREIEALLTAYIDMAKLLAHRTHALTVAMEMIGIGDYDDGDSDIMLEEINKALVCESCDSFVHSSETIQ